MFGERGEDQAQQNPEPPQEEAEVVTDCGEGRIVGVAGAVVEVVAVHAVLVLEMATGSTAARRRISRLICGVTRRFCLDV
jgi:hypothetical protein